MTAIRDTIERIERVLNLTHKNSITVTIPRLTAERAVSMLKEHEAVKIEVKKINNSGRCGRCPNCLMELNEMDYPNYCGFCGQAVKWND